MARYKPYDYDQLTMVAVCLSEQLLPNTFEYALDILIEHKIDMSLFDARYNNDATGCQAYDPKVLLKIVLFGYARGLLSSRKIERACRENITFMALTCGQAPDHATIANFVSSMEPEIQSVFQKVLLICDEEGLLDGTCLALDGVKLPSNASKEMSGTFDELRQKKVRLQERLTDMMQTHKCNDRQSQNSKDTQKQQAKKLVRTIAKIEQFLQQNEPKAGLKKENKSNVTDNDSHQMKTSHGVIQGYNAQALVDSKHQIIMHADAGNSGQDDEHLLTMIDGAKETFAAINKSPDTLTKADILADNNYFSPTNLQKCIDENLSAYIPDQNFRRRDPRLCEGEPKFSLADFPYDDKTDTYTCRAGQTLTRSSDIKRGGQKYYRHYVAPKKVCLSCTYRHQCLLKKNATRRHLTVPFDKRLADYVSEMVRKIDSDAGSQIYQKRFGIIEPVFANIREQKRMDRFLLRGKTKVNIQWCLYCLVHNIEKLINYGTGKALCTT